MITVKYSDPFHQWPYLRQTPNSQGEWGKYEFLVNDPNAEQCDFWVVCDGLIGEETAVCSPENTIFITWEPPTVKRYSPKFLSQFATVITCHTDIKHPNVIFSQQGHPWHVGKSYDELNQPLEFEKTKSVSIICSDKQFTEGHKKRFDFAWALKNHFGDDIDLFGRGILDFDNKWDVLAPYKYSIAIENLDYPHWLTEKMPDCFLAETFPFYYGCPNVESYFSRDSFELIDIDDVAGSIKVIENVISNERHYDMHKPDVIRAKYTYLNTHSLFPFIVSLCEGKALGKSEKIRLKPDTFSVENRFKRLGKRILNRIRN